MFNALVGLAVAVSVDASVMTSHDRAEPAFGPIFVSGSGEYRGWDEPSVEIRSVEKEQPADRTETSTVERDTPSMPPVPVTESVTTTQQVSIPEAPALSATAPPAEYSQQAPTSIGGSAVPIEGGKWVVNVSQPDENTGVQVVNASSSGAAFVPSSGGVTSASSGGSGSSSSSSGGSSSGSTSGSSGGMTSSGISSSGTGPEMTTGGSTSTSSTTSGGTEVPEPAPLLLIALAGVAGLLRRKLR